MNRRPSAATWLAKAGLRHDAATGGVTPAMTLSSTYARDERYELPSGGLYGRDDNPLYLQAEDIIKGLEGGADTALFASGLAAAAAVVATLGAGDRVVLGRQGYYGVRVWLEREAQRTGFEIELVDTGDPAAMVAALGDRTATLVWVECPANPTWEVPDIEETVRLAHAAGARLLVDATAATPLICRPLVLGADYVLHSATKFLNGHSDVIAGVLTAARDDDEWRRIREVRHHSGSIPGPFETWLLIRGMRTLDVRLRRSCANAMAIARHFAEHPRVRQVLYPGLASHPGHEVAKAQWDTIVGFTGMLSLRVAGDAAWARAIATRTRLFVPATSLGGVESLIEHRASVEQGPEPVSEDLLRLSVGIEDPEELVADLEQAMDRR